MTPTQDHPPRSSSLYPDSVSPPESVHNDDEDKRRGERESPDVSPISESSSPSFKQSPASTLGKFNSNLPVPKKTRKFWNRPSVGLPEQGKSLTHWDVYSGEPTTSEKGKPPSTTPSAVKLHADPSPASWNGYGTSTHISAGNPSPGSAIGRKRVASRDFNNTPIVRPEWKGAGGRQKIVNPLTDKPLPSGKAPRFPPGSEKYLQEQREKERLAEQIAKEQQEQMRKNRMAEDRAKFEEEQRRERQIAEERAKRQELQIQEETMARERANRQRERSEEERKVLEEANSSNTATTAPLWSVSHSSHPLLEPGEVKPDQQITPSHEVILDDPSPPASQKLPVRQSSLAVDDIRSPLARNPSTEEMTDRRSQALPELPNENAVKERTFSPSAAPEERPRPVPTVIPKETAGNRDLSQLESTFDADLQKMNIQDEPPSRFSMTTCATSTFDSPPATPDLSSNSPSMSTTPNSILNRKRPIAPAGLPSSRVTSRKPTPSEVRGTTQVTPDSKRKSLPKSPPEVQAVSRVASLQAKLDNLRRRRTNLQTVIHELTHVVQPSSIAYDMASRQEIKRTVEGLNKELAEVIKDEHETGLKLHRTMKRNDEFAAYEPTSIWVRRVTS